MIKYIKNLFKKKEKIENKKLLSFEEWISVGLEDKNILRYITIDEIFYKDYDDYVNDFIQEQREQKINELLNGVK